MRSVALSLVLSLMIIKNISAQVSINTTGAAPNGSSMLDITSTTKGLLIPRMTTAQRDLIPPVTGLMIYNTSTNAYNYWNGSAWSTIEMLEIIELNF